MSILTSIAIGTALDNRAWVSLRTSPAVMLPLVMFLTLTPATWRLSTFLRLYSQLTRLARLAAWSTVWRKKSQAVSETQAAAIAKKRINLFFIMLDVYSLFAFDLQRYKIILRIVIK